MIKIPGIIRTIRFVIAVLVFLLMPHLYSKGAEADKLKILADVRVRGESDWDSKKSDGTFRDDRDRMRYRLRFGFNYKWSNSVKFGGRIRSGDQRDQQSPHNTFGSEMDPGSFSIDKVFIQGQHELLWWSLGKNSFSFWKQNELFWDDDVTPEGVSLGSEIKLGEFKIKPTLGAYIINHSKNYFGNDSKLIAGQIAIEGKVSDVKLEFATGIFAFDKLPDKNDGAGENPLDYNIFNSGIKLGMDVGIPLTFGFDFMMNLVDYGAGKYKNIVKDYLKDEKYGLIASVKLGSLKKQGDWLLAYYFTQIQKYSVVDYFAQDDWIRWNYSDSEGNGLTGARSSNFGGSEIRLGYAFGSGFNCVLRTYLVEALVKKGGSSDKALETGNRIRLDFNIKIN
jgi:Putative porin